MIENDFFKSGTPCLGFIARSGTGKTSLLEKLIRHFRSVGLRIAVIKHSHHDFEIDVPGKDSYRLRKAGALQTLITSPYRWALINEERQPENANILHNAVQQLSHDQLDCILIEGFKNVAYPKIELHRTELNQPTLFAADPSIIAIATNHRSLSDCTFSNCELPLLNIDNSRDICQFIINIFSLKSTQ